ncbi:erythromycin esterase family protein [Motilimonas pumila]|uniref:Erythromycin esterase family protein n=1 Tax=Motilimonas pumila TaxID=2303987 RepID=A0A418YJR8_9GAMM|nr:erythromycin esterase family protein [Motilimonas pumila]RJG51195.1 hypothetical protein D1Z90_00175 [Motilimonas pumila]
MKSLWKVLPFTVIIAACGGSNGSSEDIGSSVQYNAIASTQISSDNSDLQPIIATLKDYDIIGLGEPTHGGALANRLRGRILKGLHQEGELELIIFEAGLYDGLAAWQQYLTKQQPLVEAITGPHANYMFMQRHSADIAQIVNYVDEQDQLLEPLALVGYEARLTSDPACLIQPGESRSVMFEELYQYLASKNINLTAMNTIYDIAPVMMCSWYFNTPYEQAQHQELMAALQQLEQALEQQSQQEDIPTYDPASPRDFRQYASFWLQIAKSLQGQALTTLHNEAYEYADARSADNVRWLRDVWFATSKQSAIWGHNIHVLNDPGTVTDVLVAQNPALSAYNVGFIQGSGEVVLMEFDYTLWPDTRYSFNYDANTLNRQLLSAGLPIAFIDLTTENQNLLLFSGNYPIHYHWGGGIHNATANIMNGLVFIPIEEPTTDRY